MIIFIASWEGVDMRVVEHAPLSIAPGESLVSNPKMLIRDELRSWGWALPLVLHVEPHIYGHQDDTWKGHEEGQVLPGLGGALMS